MLVGYIIRMSDCRAFSYISSLRIVKLTEFLKENVIVEVSLLRRIADSERIQHVHVVSGSIRIAEEVLLLENYSREQSVEHRFEQLVRVLLLVHSTVAVRLCRDCRIVRAEHLLNVLPRTVGTDIRLAHLVCLGSVHIVHGVEGEQNRCRPDILDDTVELLLCFLYR